MPDDGAPPLLQLDKVSLSFGGLRALHAVDLHVAEREVVSVIGPNGAGKSTIFNVITGIYEPSAGEIRFAGNSLVGLSPNKITRAGIARTFQSLRLFLNMSVKENVKAATYGSTKSNPFESMLRLPRARREEREVDALAEDVLSFFGQRLLGYRFNQPAYVLSYANRRRLEIARAMATGARMLLLDEPAAGMNPNETHEITELIARLRDERGYTILVVEHDMHVVEGISNRVVAMDHGEKLTEGTFHEVSNHPDVVEAYLGRNPDALHEEAVAAHGEAATSHAGGGAPAGDAARSSGGVGAPQDGSTVIRRTPGAPLGGSSGGAGASPGSDAAHGGQEPVRE